MEIVTIRRFAPALLPASILAVACHAGGVATGPVPIPGAAATGTVVYPPSFDETRPYPVVVMLPASNGAATQMLRYYTPPGYAIVVLSAGQGTPDDYATGAAWSRTIERYERQMLADLDALAARGQVDTAHVVLAGFSMGGDLAWALALRNPERVHGAVVMASRASYRRRSADHGVLAARRMRFFFTIGDQEERARVNGARAAARLLDSLGVACVYRGISGGHIRAPAEVFAEALQFVLSDTPVPTACLPQ
jgi:pimeloyl-ACP methyl ester carboxylesterase